MPSIEENRRIFGEDYDWSQRGEEWSVAWGGADMEWYGTLLPRLHAFLPAERIVEIAPGHGRWTHYLKDLCDELIGVDLSETCVQACRRRFADQAHLRFLVNDGTSLPEVEDASVDLVFSFDSLVHADETAMRGYLDEIGRCLAPEGVAWLHHSNLGAYVDGPPIMEHTHDRDPQVTAEKTREYAKGAGLRCLGQELINWGTDHALIDAISLFCRLDSRWTGDGVLLQNTQFMDEVRCLRRLAGLYRPERDEAGRT